MKAQSENSAGTASMRIKNIPAIVIHCDIALFLEQHGPCGAGQVHSESAERGRVFRVQRI